jgi:outer membrane protein assembly factor BamB
MKNAFLFLLLLSSLSFAGEAWKIDTGDGISEQPLIYGARVIAATSEGKIYSVEPPVVKWTYNAEAKVVSEPLLLGNQIIIATEEKILSLSALGVLNWELELPQVRGAAASDKIYVADKNGLQAINADGTIAWNFMPGAEIEGYSPDELQEEVMRPLATPNYVAFGYGDKMYALRTSGAFLWKKEMGGMWNTPPTFHVNTLYVGTAEGILYGLDMLTGDEKSRFNIFEQVSTSPVAYGGTIIIGTSENGLYGISAGKVQWSLELDGRVSRHMELPSASNTLYLTTSRSLYAVNPSNGEILFKRPFIDWPGSPAFFRNEVVLGTEDGKIYGIDSSKACSILYPEQDFQIGDALLNISGLAYSSSGSASAQVRINGEAWLTPDGANEWTLALDPLEYPYGLMEIECRVPDESEPYALSTIVHAANFDERLMSITHPYSVSANAEFEITAFDSRGVPINGAKAVVDGAQTISGDEYGVMSLSLEEGDHSIEITRPGYASEEIYISAKGEPTLAYLLGGLFLIVLIGYVYFLFVRKPKKKELIIKEKH